MINLTGVEDSAHTVLAAQAAHFNVLVGDVNQDGFVLSGDYTATRQHAGSPVNADTFRYDMNADGFVLSGDYTIVRQRSGNTLGQ